METIAAKPPEGAAAIRGTVEGGRHDPTRFLPRTGADPTEPAIPSLQEIAGRLCRSVCAAAFVRNRRSEERRCVGCLYGSCGIATDAWRLLASDPYHRPPTTQRRPQGLFRGNLLPTGEGRKPVRDKVLDFVAP
jgi:hypothetical protein